MTRWVLLCLVLAACSPRFWTAGDVYAELHPELAPEVATAVKSSGVVPGMTEEEVAIAIGWWPYWAEGDRRRTEANSVGWYWEYTVSDGIVQHVQCKRFQEPPGEFPFRPETSRYGVIASERNSR